MNFRTVKLTYMLCACVLVFFFLSVRGLRLFGHLGHLRFSVAGRRVDPRLGGY